MFFTSSLLHSPSPLAVVEDGELPEDLAHAEPAQAAPALHHLELALGRHVEVGPGLA